VNALELLHPTGFPEHFYEETDEPLMRKPGDFDPSRYLSVLGHLSMQAGYVLDYVLASDDLGGAPILYARPQRNRPFRTYEELAEARPGDYDRSCKPPWSVCARQHAYLGRIRTDGSPEGFLQLALLDVLGGQFYLWWHAAYNDYTVICSDAGLDSLAAQMRAWDMAIPEDVLAAARATPLQPRVTLTEDTATVQVLTFTKWGGFQRRTYVVRRRFPHKLLERRTDDVAAWRCDMIY
jgi:hypothetical protein